MKKYSEVTVKMTVENNEVIKEALKKYPEGISKELYHYIKSRSPEHHDIFLHYFNYRFCSSYSDEGKRIVEAEELILMMLLYSLEQNDFVLFEFGGRKYIGKFKSFSPYADGVTFFRFVDSCGGEVEFCKKGYFLEKATILRLATKEEIKLLD